jgi:hypothetical protein
MRKTEPISLNRLIGGRQGPLSGLLDHSRQIQHLTQALRQQLPAPMADHCRVANLRDGTLVLAADSPAWSSKIRFHADKLLKTLNKKFNLGVSKVRIIVVPEAALPKKKPLQRTPISAATASLLEQCAESEHDPALRAALLRLSRRNRRR